MTDSELIRQQRTALGLFRRATTARIQAESGAEARRNSERSHTDESLAQVEQTAHSRLAEANKALEQARSLLGKNRLEHLMVQDRPAQPTASSSSDLAWELDRCVSDASTTGTKISTGLETWTKSREAISSRRRLLITFAIGALGILVVTGFLGYRAWRIDQLYQSANAAIQVKNWDMARTDLEELASIQTDYKDAQKLLRESYYRTIGLQISVNAPSDWQDTGVTVQSGELVTITYIQGKWAWSGNSNVDADGIPNTTNLPSNLFPNANHGSLIGRIGGEVFAIGKRATQNVTKSGPLYLRINDNQVNDDAGSITVRIEVK